MSAPGVVDGYLIRRIDFLEKRVAELEAGCRAGVHTLVNAELNGAVLWVRPPHQIEFVHETLAERLSHLVGVNPSVSCEHCSWRGCEHCKGTGCESESPTNVL